MKRIFSVGLLLPVLMFSTWIFSFSPLWLRVVGTWLLDLVGFGSGAFTSEAALLWLHFSL